MADLMGGVEKQEDNSQHSSNTSSCVGRVNKLNTGFTTIATCSYMWIINNYNCRKINSCCIKSPTFSFSNNVIFSCNLRLYPNGDLPENSEYMSLFVDITGRRHTWSPSVDHTFKFSIMDIEQKKQFEKQIILPANSKVAYAGFPQYILLESDFYEKADSLLTDYGTLTLQCEVTVSRNFPPRNTIMQSKTEKSQLALDLGRLQESRNLSDVTLIAKEKEFHSHKAILAACSDVFLAMFEHEMAEKMQNKVQIEDIEDEVLQDMLRFIYTGVVNGIDENLFIAADKYLLYELKKRCEESLCSTLNIENVVNRLLLADRHTCQELKCHAIDFLNCHPDEVMKADGWMAIVDKHPCLIAEALSAVSKNKTHVGESLNISSGSNQQYVYNPSMHLSETASSVLHEDAIIINRPTYRIATPTSWSYTWLKDVSHENEVSNLWEVDGSTKTENGFRSITFCANRNKNIKGHLQIIRKCDTYGLIRLVLECENFEVDTEIKLSVKDNSDSPIPKNELSGKAVFQKKMPRYWESEVFTLSQYISPFSPMFELDCVISYITTDTVSISVQQKADDVVTPVVYSLSNNLHRLLESQKMSDVTLIVKDKEIPAHKAILAARSSVFSDTFKRNFKENRLEITDMDYEICLEMLRFIYTGDVSPNFNMERMGLALLDSANKYALEGLKAICERFLSTNLSIQNSANVLTFAERHQLPELIKRSLDLIKNHLEEVVKTEGWERLFQNHAHLLVDIYKSAVQVLIPHPHI